MSVRTDVVNLNININGNKAQNDLNNLRKKSADLAFELKGLKKGTQEYIEKSNELRKVNDQMAALKKEIGLTSLTQKELINELNKLKALRGSVQPFSAEFKNLTKSIKETEARLYDVRNGVQGFASFFSKIKDEVKQFGVVAAGYLGFQFISSQFQNIIRGSGVLSDQLADLRRVAGLTAAEADNLNTKFKSLDTRTSAQGLREIAIIAGKLGVAKEDIFGFTESVDQLVVTLGDELGNADQITTQLGKILNVFDGKVDGENISRLGNVFVELANSGAATGGFIADFDQRLSGIAKSAGIGLGALSGLGAGLEEMGARVESSSTAIQKLIISISSDIPAAAKIAGLSTAEFNKLFKFNPTEALLKYSEGLVKNKSSFAEVTASLKDAGEEGARTIEVISKLGQNSDVLRKRIDLGTQALQSNTAITEAFALKNETFGATLDKLGKEFNKLVTSPAVTGFLQNMVNGFLDFINVLKQVPEWINENIVALRLIAAGILINNLARLKSIAIMAIEVTGLKSLFVSTNALAIAQKAADIATTAWSLASALLTGNIAKARKEFALLRVLLGTNPLGVLLIALGAAVVAFKYFTGKAKEASDSIKQLQKEQKLLNDLNKTAAESTADQRKYIDERVRLINGETASLDAKKKAVAELIALDPKFLEGLKLSNDGHLIGKELIDKYVESLNKKALAEAISAKKTEAFKKITEGQLKIDQNQLSENAQGLIDAYNTALDKAIKNRSVILPVAPRLSQGDQLSRNEQNTGRAKVLEGQGELDALNRLEKKYISVLDVGAKVKNQNDQIVNPPVVDDKSDKKGDALKAKAEKFYRELKALKDKVEAGNNPEEQEIQQANAKYAELLREAKEYYFKNATSKKVFNEEEKIIEDLHQKDLQSIFEKYYKKRFDAASEQEYLDSLNARAEFSEKLKAIAAQEYAEGKITRIQYAAELKQIDKDETKDRIIIAQDYSETVKKAATDVKEFRKKEEKETTEELVAETDARIALAENEKAAKLRRAVLTTKPGSNSNLAARKAELKYEEEQEVQAEKDKWAALGEVVTEESEVILQIRADYAQKEKDLDQEWMQQKIAKVQEYVGYFMSAINSLNAYITNRENAQFAKEKALNEKKRKEYKQQLDNKLISQAQYDKKVNELNEEQDKKERELKRKQAKREKALNIFRAIVNVAAGVASSLSYGGPVGIALAAITAVLGALEIAAIASEPLPEVGRGKYFTEGDKHSDPSRGIPVKIERGEAVMSAAAMDDDTNYIVEGNAKQITSALNSLNGGANWAGGAIIKRANWASERPASINPGLPRQLAQGGIVRALDNAGGNDFGEATGILRNMVSKIEENTQEIKTMKKNLKAVIVYRDFKDQQELYEASEKLSGLR